MSFVAFERSRALEKTGIAIPARMPIVAITTSNSIRVNPRWVGGGELFSMILSGAHDMRLNEERKRKRAATAKIA